ncbi:MAG TPA: urate hydroxylase PuuD [Rhodoblastus sp.]|nr:urate hydroxylase PuuD [Rhodoblastus sp.]
MTLNILHDWCEFFLRWLHVVAAIFWVGLALGFLRLNLTLKSTKADVWRAADDGFFRISRDMNVPADAAPQIGWFRWEAYVVWLSGFALMVAIYFVRADLYLIDPAVLPLASWQAIGLALLWLVVGWLGYDRLAKAPWSETARRTAIAIFLVALAFALTRIFSGRGAFLLFGAIIGTIMAANVAHYLVPNQRRMLEAVRNGVAPDEARFAISRQRALHNNYLSLPVLFLMLANHYPLAFASRFNWIVASLALVAGAAIRHFYIARHRGSGDLWWTWGVAAAAGAAMIALSLLGVEQPQTRAAAPQNAMDAIAAVVAPRLADVEDVVADRCAVCHARAPAWPGLAAPPKGVMLESRAQIVAHARDIAAQAVWTHAMPPPGAETGMTDAERRILSLWVAAGAPAR